MGSESADVLMTFYFYSECYCADLVSVVRISEISDNLPDVLTSSVIGRTVEIRQLMDILTYSSLLATITGCHGIGKSVVAICVAQTLRSRYVDTVRDL